MDRVHWNNALNRIFAAIMGLAILAYWALPFDVLSQLGLPRFQGGIEVFFRAGAMMVLGAVWALVAITREEPKATCETLILRPAKKRL